MALNQDQKISFIPKKSLVKGAGDGDHRPVSLFLFVSFVVLVLVWGAYGGLLFYAQSIETSIKNKEKQLQDFSNGFDRPLIARAKALEKKIDMASSVIQSHTVTTPVFEAIEKSVTTSSQIAKFNFAYKDASSASSQGGDTVGSPYVLTLDVETLSFAAAADLEDALVAHNDVFTSVEVKDIRLVSETGKVNLNIVLGIKPEHVAFIKGAQSADILPTTIPGETQVEDTQIMNL